MASETVTEAEPTPVPEDMELVTTSPEKRDREEGEDTDLNGAVLKKHKVADDHGEDEKSVEEARMETIEEEREDVTAGPVSLGPKTFGSSVQMFDYFYKFLHHWPINTPANQYESLTLLDLIKKGHSEPEKKIGPGVHAFEIRYHPTWQSRCFFVIREDKSVEDFSFRKCVDQILPLPENMKIKSDVNKVLGGNGKGKKGGGGGRGGRGRGGGGRGRGRGGNSRR